MGRNNADFQGVVFKNVQDKKGRTLITATHPDHGSLRLGWMRLDKDGTLGNVYVHPDHRRKGIATGLLNHAKQLGINLKHSENRTEEGDAWAKSTGDPLPKNKGVLDFD